MGWGGGGGWEMGGEEVGQSWCVQEGSSPTPIPVLSLLLPSAAVGLLR